LDKSIILTASTKAIYKK